MNDTTRPLATAHHGREARAISAPRPEAPLPAPRRRFFRIALAAIAAALLALAAVPAFAHGGPSNASEPEGISLKGMSYKDGSYLGSATGFRPGLTVEVTVKGGRVSAVKVVSHNEVNQRFYAYPIQVLPSAIVKSQSTKLDAVSGATCTSKGILAAVEDALKNAVDK
jgi:uncharacterized protein with FMN-binding domain